jgi:hypothetical protein
MKPSSVGARRALAQLQAAAPKQRLSDLDRGLVVLRGVAGERLLEREVVIQEPFARLRLRAEPDAELNLAASRASATGAAPAPC